MDVETIGEAPGVSLKADKDAGNQHQAVHIGHGISEARERLLK